MDKIKNDKTEKLQNKIARAFDMLRDSLGAFDAFKIVFVLLHYKYFEEAYEKYAKESQAERKDGKGFRINDMTAAYVQEQNIRKLDKTVVNIRNTSNSFEVKNALFVQISKALKDISAETIGLHFTEVNPEWSNIDSKNEQECIAKEGKNDSNSFNNTQDIQIQLEQIPQTVKRNILELFNSQDLSFKDISFQDFEAVVSGLEITYLEFESKKVADYIIDPSLSKLMVKLLSPQPLERLCFPFYGLGQIPTTAMDHICDVSKPSIDDIKAVIDGRDDFLVRLTEIELSGNREILSLAELRIAAKAYSLNKTGDDLAVKFIARNPDDYSKPDIIFLNTPFGCRRPGLPSPIYQAYEIPILNSPQNKRGLLEIFHYLDRLSDSGRMGVLIPIEPLSSTSRVLKDMSIKESIIENNYLEAVIQLPEQPPFSGTAMTPVLLVINKNKSRKHKIFFAKIKPVRPGSTVVSVAEVNRVVNAYNNTDDNADAIVALEDIQRQNYNLSPDLYIKAFSRKLKKLIENKQAVHLSELCTIEVGRAKKIDLGGAIKYIGGGNPCLPFIEAKDLARDVTEPYLDLNDVYKGIEIKDHHIFDKKCILVTRIGLDLKPTIFDPDYEYNDKSKEIILGFSVAALIPNEEIIDFEYLYYQLHDPIVKKQRRPSFSDGKIHHRGGRVPRNPLHYLDELVIPVPSSLKDQRMFVDQQKTSLLETENAKLEAFKERLKVGDKKREAEFSMVEKIEHNMRPRLSGLKTCIDLLKEFSEQKQLSKDDDIKISNLLDVADKEHGSMVDTLEKAVEDTTRNKEEKRLAFQEVDICKLFKEDIIPLYENRDIKGFEIIVNCNNEVENIKLDKTAFKEAINNIIENACDWRFKDNKCKDAKLTFDISENDDFVIIDYKNNGKMFPEEIKEEDFLKRRGYGGKTVNYFMEVHNAKFEIVRCRNCNFIIKIPRKAY